MTTADKIECGLREQFEVAKRLGFPVKLKRSATTVRGMYGLADLAAEGGDCALTAGLRWAALTGHRCDHAGNWHVVAHLNMEPTVFFLLPNWFRHSTGDVGWFLPSSEGLKKQYPLTKSYRWLGQHVGYMEAEGGEPEVNRLLAGLEATGNHAP